MKMVVGLGNPGSRYRDTRHNTGFMVLDRLARELGAVLSRREKRALVGSVQVRGEKVLLVKPQTFMNDSGAAVGPLAAFYKLAPREIIVVHDDLDLPVGAVRLRGRGSAGGHRGVASVLAALGGAEFIRIKVGIGRPGPEGPDVVSYVLAPFTGEERRRLEPALGLAVAAVRFLLEGGSLAEAMNRFNGACFVPGR